MAETENTTSPMLGSNDAPGGEPCCDYKHILPVRFALTSEKGLALPVTAPDPLPTLENHGITLRTAESGFIFMHWEGMPAEQNIAVFACEGGYFKLLTKGIPKCKGGKTIALCTEIKSLKYLYVRIPQPDSELLPNDVELWQLVRDNLSADLSLLQETDFASNYAAPLKDGIGSVEEYKEKPGGLSALGTSADAQDIFFEAHSLATGEMPDPAKKKKEAQDYANLLWYGSHEKTDNWFSKLEGLRLPAKKTTKKGEPIVHCLLAMHDPVGMLYDCASIHCKGLDAMTRFHCWHGMMFLSGAIAEANLAHISKGLFDYDAVYDDLLDKGVLSDEDELMRTYRDKEKYEEIYRKSGIEHFLKYAEKHDREVEKLGALLAGDIMRDWFLLLTDEGRFSVNNILLQVFKADDQEKNTEEVALPLTLARGEIFAKIHTGLAGQENSYETLRALFNNSAYLELMSAVVGQGGVPGLELCRFLYELLPFLPNSATAGKTDGALVNRLLEAINKRFGMEDGGYAPMTGAPRDIMEKVMREAEAGLPQAQKVSDSEEFTDLVITLADQLGGALGNCMEAYPDKILQLSEAQVAAAGEAASEAAVAHAAAQAGLEAKIRRIKENLVRWQAKIGQLDDELAAAAPADARRMKYSRAAYSGWKSRGHKELEAIETWVEYRKAVETGGHKVSAYSTLDKTIEENNKLAAAAPKIKAAGWAAGGLGVFFSLLNLCNIGGELAEARETRHASAAAFKGLEMVSSLIGCSAGVYNSFLRPAWSRLAPEAARATAARAASFAAGLGGRPLTAARALLGSPRFLPGLAFLAGLGDAGYAFTRKDNARAAWSLAAAAALLAVPVIGWAAAALLSALFVITASAAGNSAITAWAINHSIWSKDQAEREALIQSRVSINGGSPVDSRNQSWAIFLKAAQEFVAKPRAALALETVSAEDSLRLCLATPAALPPYSELTLHVWVTDGYRSMQVDPSFLSSVPYDAMYKNGRLFLGQFSWKNIKKQFDLEFPAEYTGMRMSGEAGAGPQEGNLLAGCWVSHGSGEVLCQGAVARYWANTLVFGRMLPAVSPKGVLKGLFSRVPEAADPLSLNLRDNPEVKEAFDELT